VKSDPVPTHGSVAISTHLQPRLGDEIRLQKLWLAVERTPWRSLAVLGASQSIETLSVAQVLAQLAWRYRGQPSGVVDLRDLSMRLIDYHVQEIRELRSIFENPTAIPIARQADAVALCITVGETNFKTAKQTIADIGRDRIVGSILVRNRPKQASEP
jgi:hypothetical protein